MPAITQDKLGEYKSKREEIRMGVEQFHYKNGLLFIDKDEGVRDAALRARDAVATAFNEIEDFFDEAESSASEGDDKLDIAELEKKIDHAYSFLTENLGKEISEIPDYVKYSKTPASDSDVVATVTGGDHPSDTTGLTPEDGFATNDSSSSSTTSRGSDASSDNNEPQGGGGAPTHSNPADASGNRPFGRTRAQSAPPPPSATSTLTTPASSSSRSRTSSSSSGSGEPSAGAPSQPKDPTPSRSLVSSTTSTSSSSSSGSALSEGSFDEEPAGPGAPRAGRSRVNSEPVNPQREVPQVTPRRRSFSDGAPDGSPSVTHGTPSTVTRSSDDDSDDDEVMPAPNEIPRPSSVGDGGSSGAPGSTPTPGDGDSLLPKAPQQSADDTPTEPIDKDDLIAKLESHIETLDKLLPIIEMTKGVADKAGLDTTDLEILYIEYTNKIEKYRQYKSDLEDGTSTDMDAISKELSNEADIKQKYEKYEKWRQEVVKQSSELLKKIEARLFEIQDKARNSRKSEQGVYANLIRQYEHRREQVIAAQIEAFVSAVSPDEDAEETFKRKLEGFKQLEEKINRQMRSVSEKDNVLIRQTAPTYNMLFVDKVVKRNSEITLSKKQQSIQDDMSGGVSVRAENTDEKWYKGTVLKKDEIIRSVAPVENGNGLILLEMDKGVVRDKTQYSKSRDDSGVVTNDLEKTMTALKMARMLLDNYKDGRIVVRGGTREERERVFAAVIYLKSMDPRMKKVEVVAAGETTTPGSSKKAIKEYIRERLNRHNPACDKLCRSEAESFKRLQAGKSKTATFSKPQGAHKTASFRDKLHNLFRTDAVVQKRRNLGKDPDVGHGDVIPIKGPKK